MSWHISVRVNLNFVSLRFQHCINAVALYCTECSILSLLWLQAILFPFVDHGHSATVLFEILVIFLAKDAMACISMQYALWNMNRKFFES
jgi:hypothetical protein